MVYTNKFSGYGINLSTRNYKIFLRHNSVDTMIWASAADESVAAVNCIAFRVTATAFIEVCFPFARSSDIDPIRIHICAGFESIRVSGPHDGQA